jgi:anti-anti-sigma factor
MELETELSSLLHRFADSDLKNVLVDFQRVPYFGSTMISILIRLNKMTRTRGGRMALCNLSATETEVLRVMKLHGQWPQYTSRQDSLDALTQPKKDQATADGR